MPDPSVLSWAIVAFALALVGLTAELLGRFSPAQPVCRRCGEDARGAVWREPVACRSCGADLAPRGAVRARRLRRSKRVMIAWSSLAILAVAVIGKDRSLADAQLRWRDCLPSGWDVAALLTPAGGIDAERLASLQRRLAARMLSEEHARSVARRLLALPMSPPAEWLPFLRSGWDGPALERWLRGAVGPLIGFFAWGNSLSARAGNSLALMPLYPSCRVERVVIDGVEQTAPLSLGSRDEVPLTKLMGDRPSAGEHRVAFDTLMVVCCDGFLAAATHEAIQRGEPPTAPYVAMRWRATAKIAIDYPDGGDAPYTIRLLDSALVPLSFTPPSEHAP